MTDSYLPMFSALEEYFEEVEYGLIYTTGLLLISLFCIFIIFAFLICSIAALSHLINCLFMRDETESNLVDSNEPVKPIEYV